ncbi:hypothetical protein D3C78_1715540 [compost metagenome]
MFLARRFTQQQLGQVQIGRFVRLLAGDLQVFAGLVRVARAAQAVLLHAAQPPVRIAVAEADGVLVVALGLGIVLALFV